MDKIDAAIEMMTERERQVAALLLEACEDREIAKQLGIAKRTVKAHMRRMFVAFGIDTGYKRVKLAVVLYRKELCRHEYHGNQSSGHQTSHT